MPRIPFSELHGTLRRKLLDRSFREDRADLCARLFAEASRDGVYSHGLNRFPRFIEMIRRGTIDVHAEPELVEQFGAVERWDGRMGPGNLNAHRSMARALEVSREHGVGCVALRNTNHWMRGGTYGWQAADAGAIAICWTNTNQNTPAWGARERRIGNNPLVVAVPRVGGHVVLDIAMAQFSYGALTSYQVRGAQLPVHGGYDEAGNLTQDPAALEASGRMLPIGYWKGSGLSILLDLVATLLSNGRSTREIPFDPYLEAGVSQVFIAFDLPRMYDGGEADRIATEIVEHVAGSAPAEPGGSVRYPGENTLKVREENDRLGIPVDPAVWEEVQAM